jgi:hypothetical protein
MRTALPFILVLLGLFAAGCIAYIAWELSSDKKDRESTRLDKPTHDAD